MKTDVTSIASNSSGQRPSKAIICKMYCGDTIGRSRRRQLGLMQSCHCFQITAAIAAAVCHLDLAVAVPVFFTSKFAFGRSLLTS